MIEDLTMLANLPVGEEEAEGIAPERDAPVTTAQAEADKAAAGETMPPPKEKHHVVQDEDDSKAERVARRGQDPPSP